MRGRARRSVPDWLGASVVFVSIVGGLGAQKVVDFSGTWVPLDPPGKGEVHEVVVVTQDETGMTATFTAEGQKDGEVIRYEFGATKTQTNPPGVVGMEVNVTTSWKGDTLVAVNSIKVRDRTRTFEQAWSRDAAGMLVITVTQPSDGGPKVTTTVYKRRESF